VEEFMNERYRVEVEKDSLVFSAGHFITFAGGVCERIHGHNWRVRVEVEGSLDENQYVFDFLALRDQTKAIVDRLDHRMLLPTRSALIRVALEGRQAVARFQDRLWSFPADECVLLPVENTTAELIARWIAGELAAAWKEAHTPPPDRLRVGVEENFGQWATCEIAPREAEGGPLA
jgi:6-pyruvoyltetrahydropterin/6-carboxytetrahydropterin synthase